MKLYNIFIKKTSEEKIEDVILIKDGFSWTAFFFSNFWFLYHKMWKEFFALTFLSLSFAIFDKYFLASDKFFIELAISIVIGLNANYWLCDHLKKQKYHIFGIIFGANLWQAKLRLFENYKNIFGTAILDLSITNPKLHKKLQKEKKSQPYFTIN